MTTEDLRNAGITPKERLENIENLLKEIDKKLDGKASEADLRTLELRVRDLELKGSNKAQEGFAIAKAARDSADSIQHRFYWFAGLCTAGLFIVELGLDKGWF